MGKKKKKNNTPTKKIDMKTKKSNEPDGFILESCRYYDNGVCRNTMTMCHRRVSNPDCVNRPRLRSHFNATYTPPQNNVKNTIFYRVDKSYHEERYGTNKQLMRKDLSNEVPEVYIFSGYLYITKERLIDYRLTVGDIIGKMNHDIIVAMDTTNGTYYMSEAQLRHHIKRGIYPNIKIVLNHVHYQSFAGEFRQNSELSLLGYHVGKNGLSEVKRHAILQHIVDNHIMSKWEVISLLQSFITFRQYSYGKDFSQSIQEWEEDIDFLSTIPYKLYSDENN